MSLLKVSCLLLAVNLALVLSENETLSSNSTEQVDRITIETSVSPNVTIPENLLKLSPSDFPRDFLNKTSKIDTLSDFRPSPQLDFYEHNKIPVVPALPEPKHHRLSSAYNSGEVPRWSEPEKPWTVKFPTYIPPTTQNHPYEFDTGERKTYYGKNRPISHKSEFDFTAPVSLEKPYKSNLDFTSIEKPFSHGIPISHEMPIHKPFAHEMAIEKPFSHEMQHNPWKKIVKFLTALIPIGLLISALTPTVITVTPMNETMGMRNQGKFRSSELKQSAKKFISSLGCEDRILCELILSSGSSKNGEEHVQNLLDTFTKNGKAVERAEEMRKIFQAVASKECSSIVCEKINNR